VSGIEDYEASPLARGCLVVHGVGDVDAATSGVIELAAVVRAVRQQRARELARTEFDIGVSVDRYEKVIERARQRSAAPAVAVAAQDDTEWQVRPRAWWRWVRTWVTQRA
jgi:hypothetical protein